ncbi:MAG: Ldh family oxidoreductase [Phreatobacter sp.]|uniref:Ldh family oxidoreductase n=1 Tax=Phreatobacter sp. TaxID=1966341 RepID=UPI001A490A17|nr:Ldh family oxidoreductase [Phreatobacter sp.]MBL8570718.1 Ldh family oxidoreductase [Phreatobacter sp.]
MMHPLPDWAETLEEGGRIGRSELTNRTADILAAAGVPMPGAAQAAALLVECQARGINSHGLAHLPIYLQRIGNGAMDPKAVPAILDTGAATAVVDGRNGLGVLVGLAAIDEACRRADAIGMGACAVRDSNHFGAAAPLVGRAAGSGFIALAFSNAAPTMAPAGGREPILGTNPLAAAFPRAGRQPLIIDMATSAVARGRLRQAALRKQVIPADWALDAAGRPTTDAEAALAGTVQPLGGPKGYALTLMVELLCTALSGGRPGYEVLNPHDPAPAAAGVSHLFIALDPRRFAGLDEARSAATRLGARIEASPPGADGIAPRLPGTRSETTAAARARDGIPLTSDLLAHLRKAVRLVAEMSARPSFQE